MGSRSLFDVVWLFDPGSENHQTTKMKVLLSVMLVASLYVAAGTACPDAFTLLFGSLDCLAILEHLNYNEPCETFHDAKDCYVELMGGCSDSQLREYDLYDSYHEMIDTVNSECN